jgi:hypothetical protein
VLVAVDVDAHRQVGGLVAHPRARRGPCT